MWRRKRPAGEHEAARSGAPEGQHVEHASFTESYTAADFARDQHLAQRNAQAEAGTDVLSPDAPGQSADEQLGWCSVNGVFAGLSGGALGAVFGLGERRFTLQCALNRHVSCKSTAQQQPCCGNERHGPAPNEVL
jgi:hypothetical protein